MIKCICKICKKKFHIKPYRRNVAKFCSYKCYWKSLQDKIGKQSNQWKGGKVKRICQSCQKEFWIYPSNLKKGGKFCSNKCHSKSRIGIIPPYSFPKGHIPWMKGRKNPRWIGKNNPRWNGGRSNWGKYIFIYHPKHSFNNHGYVAQHRLVMEKHLGRYLTKKEVVHHINGNTSDNRLKNLKLFPNQSEHMKFHHLPHR